jgi:hypothetical protein
MSSTLDQGGVTRIVTAMQELIKASYLTQQTLAKGLTINTTLPSYTVAGLPAVAPVGAQAYATNGRGPGEGAGAGTGCAVVGSGSIWRAVWSGVAPTV